MTNTSRRTPDYKINPKAFASPGYMDINIWPFLSVVGVLFIWAMNVLMPGMPVSIGLRLKRYGPSVIK